MSIPAGRRSRMLSALAFVLLGFVLFGLSAPANAQGGNGEGNGIDVVQVDGLLDPANVALIKTNVRDAEARDSTLLVVQLAGTGAVDSDVEGLVEVIDDATIPIGIWIGPSGSNARGASAFLALHAPVVSVAGRAGIGPVYPVRFDETGTPSTRRSG